jgi:hypothetical protein
LLQQQVRWAYPPTVLAFALPEAEKVSGSGKGVSHEWHFLKPAQGEFIGIQQVPVAAARD